MHLPHCIDVAFTIGNIMEVLKKLKAWESFYFTVTGNHIYDDFQQFKDVPEDRKMSLKTFMRKRPGKISWTDLAVAAYYCGEEEVFDQLSEKMRSPEGIPHYSMITTTILICLCLFISGVTVSRSNIKLSSSKSSSKEV